ncbi:MAG TPA: helix-turn-helix domain-containing protein [Methanocorpusculum sp.]|nr:helix-turn-helix domain-containing protein [Methanocorpusculum sp.]
MQNENVVVLEHGSPEAQKIAKAMSSPTSADLFNALTGNPQSATALSVTTGLPLTTVKYHLENMLDAGLVEISRTRWSEKGREMKIYAIKDQVVVFAPRKTVNATGIVEKYGTLAGVTAIACSLIIAVPRALSEAVGFTGAKTFGVMMVSADSAPAITGMSSYMPVVHSVVQGFLIAALTLLAFMMVYELYIVKKNG